MAVLTFSAAVEGPTDEAVLCRVVEGAGASLGTVYGRNGKKGLLRDLAGYNHAARFAPWIVLVDLDQSAPCAPEARSLWLAGPAPRMYLRIAVHAIEAWLLADREGLADYLGVPLQRVPVDPESLPHPKQDMVNLARFSRRRDVREEMVPTLQGGRQVGPLYGARVIEFVQQHWRPERAALRADSLQRFMERLHEITASPS